jgi:leader peptidase (prepilin peptidase)/N-methyltransferase
MPHSVLLSAAAVLFGLVVGSFINVLIYRLPRGKNFVSGRSKCPHCDHTIAWYDNVPLASWILLGGRCRSCRAKISMKYPLVEALTGTIAGLVVWHLGLTTEAAWAFLFFSILLVITFVDWSHRIIPDVLSLGGTALGVAGAFFRPGITPVESLLGALLGGGVLLAVAAAYRALRKAEGMGGGDVKLMAMVGAFLGWRMVFPVLIIASFCGAAYGLYLMRRGASARTAVPFGSFLAPAAAVVYVFGTPLWDAYLRLTFGAA